MRFEPPANARWHLRQLDELTRDMGKLDLWEYGRRKLGLGDWDECSETPYWKWAGLEAHKLFLVMRKRRISNGEFIAAVDYCARHHLHIANAVWVFKHLAAAKDEMRLFAREFEVGALEEEIDRAVRCERALAAEEPEQLEESETWASQLERAQGPYRKEVLAEWQAQRAHLFPSR